VSDALRSIRDEGRFDEVWHAIAARGGRQGGAT
jgi:hypothetical protein